MNIKQNQEKKIVAILLAFLIMIFLLSVLLNLIIIFL
jgi:hypothetical protein